MRVIPDSVELAVLGGGINGAAVASLASELGYRTVLFEKRDYGSGTSSKSSKLIHGGLRYLETGQFDLVRESLLEREALLRSRPHLVKSLPFLMPSYSGDLRPTWMLRAGMVLYDVLATTSTLPRPEWLSPREAQRRASTLRTAGLRGAGLYYDAQVDDARLVLEEILDAEELGTVCANHRAVTELSESAAGCVLTYRDELTGALGSVRARGVVVAAGPWTDKIRAELLGYGRALLRPTRGTHLVLREPLSEFAVVCASPVDGRIFFAIPWRDTTLIGTTDDDDNGDPDSVAPTAEDVSYLLDSAQSYFPERRLKQSDVVGAFAGLRPLIASGGQAASAVSREADIVCAGHMVFIVGGKLTTYRAVARRALASVARVLGAPQQSAPSPRAWLRSHAPRNERRLIRDAASNLSARGVPQALAVAVSEKHWRHVAELIRLLSDQPSLAEPLCTGCPALGVEVAVAVIREGALTLDDVLERRLGLGLDCQCRADAAEPAARLAAGFLGWSDERCAEEVERFRKNGPTGCQLEPARRL